MAGQQRDEKTRMSGNDAKLTREEILAAKRLIERALRPHALPVYSPDERLALAILAANHSQLQRARGRKSKSAAKHLAEYRRNHVNLLLRYVVERKYRRDEKTATSLATVMRIVQWLDEIGIEASESQVRRDIHAALKLGPLPSE
jgi:hypothetical protein